LKRKPVDFAKPLDPRYGFWSFAALFTRISRSDLAQMPAFKSARLRRIGRQVDVPAVGKLEIPRQDMSTTTLDDVSRTIGEMAWKTIDLAHDTLTCKREL
jgi:hypothetical protein